MKKFKTEAMKKTRTIKELLQLMLDNIDKFKSSIRRLNNLMCMDGLISIDEYNLICDYLDGNKKNTETKEWLKNQIKQLEQ